MPAPCRNASQSPEAVPSRVVWRPSPPLRRGACCSRAATPPPRGRRDRSPGIWRRRRVTGVDGGGDHRSRRAGGLDLLRRGGRRGPGRQGRRCWATLGDARRPRRDPRHDDLVALGLRSGRRHRRARPLRRAARVQPGAADGARRARLPGPAAAATQRTGDRAVRGARQDAGRRPRHARASSSTACCSPTCSPPSTCWTRPA